VSGVPAAAPGDPHAHELCTGTVWHVRETPFRHAFDYRVHLLLLDLDDLDAAFSGHRLWSLDARNVGSFRQRDHLHEGDAGAPLGERARDAVAERLGFRPTGRVRLLAHPRYFGYAFNPVTFYLFETPAAGTGAGSSRGVDTLEAILLEVANTPWNETHRYALDARGSAGPWAFEIDKDFHVSPFLPMDMRYRFRFALGDGRFEVVKQNWQDETRVFTARMALDRAPLSGAALSRALRGFPPMTVQVVGGIYWQALRLWLKGARYHPHPPPGAGSGRRSVPH
jgi:DUF1365 family protein